MRHRVYGKHLGRNKDERDNLFRGLVRSFFTYGSIQTSEAKAKSIKGLVDKVINLAKNKKTQGRLESFITDKNLRERLVKEVVPHLGSRSSGYTSLVKMGTRLGDQTRVVRMSLIGAEELKPIEKVTSNKVKDVTKREEKKEAVSEKKGRKRATSRLSKKK